MLLQSAFTFLCALGRIHSASVSGVDLDAQNVTVEWFEYGETKGKEVIGEKCQRFFGKIVPKSFHATCFFLYPPKASANLNVFYLGL